MSLLHKKEKQNKNNDPLIRLMTPMIAGILACVFCLVSMTWAWFTASVDAPTQTMQAAAQFTKVKVYEVVKSEDENDAETRKLVKPTENSMTASEEVSLVEELKTDKDISVVTAEEPLVWELSPEKSYEIVMTGGGTASTGYCKVALSHTESGSAAPETKLYQTAAFEKDTNVTFTYNTGGFSKAEGVTETEWKEYVEKTTPPTLAIASFWGSPAEEETAQVSLMSARNMAEEEIMLLSDGDVLGLAPIPCPEAKAETEVELEGFELQEGAVISAEEDYKVSLTLKEGYEMPSEVVVNIGGKDYVVSTQGAEASGDAPFYDASSGVLTVPAGLLSDGIKVSVKATATPIPEEEPEEEETEEEETEETAEEETEETTDNNETEEDNSADTSSDNNVVVDNPAKKEEDGEPDNDELEETPAGDGGNDDDNNEGETEDEKADVKLNLSQLTINLEETQIPTNADLVLTLSAKEDMELPERIVITLDKTIRDENIDDEEIEEDKTEYIINTDGKDNPEGFEFDTESGNLTISSELLEGVREITIADTEENEADEDDEKATLTFEVKNLTFDFTDDEIVTDEDVVITFTAGEGYELPETIIITIDGEEYTVYTSEEESGKNPEGITFDIETGTLTISKDLLKDAEAITIAAEGVEKEDDEENPDADNKDEPEDDKDTTGKGNETEDGETTDKEPESGTDDPDNGDNTEGEGGTDVPDTGDNTEGEGGTDIPSADDKTETEGGTDAPGGENTEVTNPETTPDDTTEGEDNDDNNGEDNGGGKGETETPEPGTEPTTPITPGTEDNIDTEQGGENTGTENGEGSTENGAGENTPDTESGGDDETTTPTEPTTPDEPSAPVVTPETSKTEAPSTSEPTTGGNVGDDSGETGSTDSGSAESSSSGEKGSAESNASSESTTTAPAASETSTPSASEQASSSSSSGGGETSANQERRKHRQFQYEIDGVFDKTKPFRICVKRFADQ